MVNESLLFIRELNFGSSILWQKNHFSFLQIYGSYFPVLSITGSLTDGNNLSGVELNYQSRKKKHNERKNITV